MSFSIQVAGRTDVGCVRKNNEDNFGFDVGNGIFVVCDGMGGQAAGEVASRLAVETVLEYFKRPPRNGAYPPEAGGKPAAPPLVDAVTSANKRIFQAAVSNPATFGMGSTLVAALVRDERAYIAHVGDSRAYLFRGNRMRQLTYDHSLVMEQVRRGLISQEEAERSQIQNIITRALGSLNSVEVDHQELDLERGDRLLLTSDGLTRGVNDVRMFAIIRESRSLEQACGSLIQAAREAGGEDNITCLLLEFN